MATSGVVPVSQDERGAGIEVGLQSGGDGVLTLISRSPGAQSTVGSAAAGAPPYTLQGAPEGNKAPKDGEPPKQ